MSIELNTEKTTSQNGLNENSNRGEQLTPLLDPSATISGWTAKRVAWATLVALGVGIAFLLLYRFYMVIFLFFVAVTLQVAMKPVVERLRKWGIRPQIGIGLIYLLLIGALLLFAWLAVPILIEQIRTVSQQLPTAYTEWRLSLLGAGNRFIRAFATALPSQLSFADVGGSAGAGVDESTLTAMMPLWQSLKTTSYAIFLFAAILMLAYYWTVEGDIVTRRLLLLVKADQREQWRTVLEEMERKIGSYFRGQAILCTIMATVSTLIYLAIGLPYALGLGLIMGLLDAIPMIGPIIGAIPAILVAMTLEPNKALWVVGAITVVQQLEGNFLIPRIMDSSVGINAVVTILAVAAFSLLFGIGGAILAIPLAAVLQILFNRFVLNIPIDEEVATSATTADIAGRSEVSSLRIQTQDLVSDIHSYARAGEAAAPISPEDEQIEDLLETIASDLDGLLSTVERAQ